MKQYDVIIIGAGSAGYVSALRAAQLGKKVAVIERNQLGGTCLNSGCIPTKALLHVAEIFHQQKDYSLLGLHGNLRVDSVSVNQRKDDVIEKLRSGIASLLQANAVDVIWGDARIIDEHTIKVNDESLTTHFIVIATGSSVAKIPLPGIEHAYTSDDILQFSDKLFDDVVIIGGGVIGVEFASLYQNFGKTVTLLEAQDRILNVFDKEISQNLTMILKRRGATIKTQANVLEISKLDERKYTITYECKGKQESVDTCAVIVAVGRKANGVCSDIEFAYEGTRLQINEHYQTKYSNIYAIGDASSKIQLAHMASHQGLYAIAHMFQEKLPCSSAVPSCVYTSPEIACVGLSEAEAISQNINVVTGKYMTLGNGKTMIANQDRGFIKVVVNQANDEIIGAQMMCDRASDMVVLFAQAIESRLTIDDMSLVIYPHPSFSEAIHEAIMDVRNQAIHSMPKKVIK